MSNFYPAKSLIGGASGALDAIDGADLTDGDGAVVITDSNAYVYHLDATSGAAENSPSVIAPDTNPGTKRWILLTEILLATATSAELEELTDGSQTTLHSHAGAGATFVDLADTPASYTGQAGKYTKVNVTEDGLEFGTPAGATDKKVGIDSGATPGYIGAASNDGVLKTSSPITYSDGGNFITLGIDETAIDHDNLSGFVGAEHLSLPNTIANVLSNHNLAAHTALGLFDEHSDVDHDQTTNFAANEHFLQTAITNVSTALSTGLLKVTNPTGALSVITDSSGNWDDAFTHKSNDGSDHSKVGANETAIGLNTTHRGLNSGNPHSVTPTELSLVIGTDVLAEQTIGIANNNLLEVDDADAASTDYARFTANGLQGRDATEVKIDLGLVIGTDILAEQTIGIADDNLVEIDDADAAATDYCRLTANGIQGRDATEVKTDLGLVIGTNVQAHDAELDSLAGLSYAAASFIKMTGVATFALRTIGQTADDLEATIDHDNLANTHNLTTDIDHDTITNGGAHDYSYISGNDGATNVTGAELEELTDGSQTTLHSHAGGGATFLDLADTPVSYDSADIGKFVRVKSDLSGLEFAECAAGATTFLALTDTPVNYTGSGGKYAKVNVGEDALEFDTPAGGGAFSSRISVYRNAAQTIVKTTEVKVELETENYDNDNEFDKDTNYRFTADVEGYYHISAQVRFTGLAAAKDCYIMLKKNGSDISVQNLNNVYPNPTPCASKDVYLDVDDYIEVWCYQGDTTTRSLVVGNTGTFLTIHRFV